jgi:hypothetical protein
MSTKYDIVINGKDKTARAFSSLNKNISSSSMKMLKMSAGIAKAGAAAGAAAAVAGIALTKASMKSLDQLAKTADKIGVTTEALRSLQHAGEITGVSTEVMNKALQKMTVSISEAADGSGIAKDTIEDLGLNAVELNKLPLDKKMNVLAKAFGNVENHADRVRYATEIFGAKGAALVNTLALGEDGLNEMAREAEHLGLSMSRIDTAQVEAANDAVSRAGGVFEGLGNQFAVSFSPIIQATADSFRQAALDSADFGNIGQKAAQMLVDGFSYVSDIFNTVYGVMLQGSLIVKQLQLAIIDFGATMTPVFQGMIDLYNTFANSFVGKKLGIEEIASSAEQAFKSMSKSAIDDIKFLEDKIIEFGQSSPPSEGIQAWYDDIQAKSRETAEVVANNAPGKVLAAVESESTQIVQDENGKRAESARALAEFEKKSAEEKTIFALGQAAKMTQGLASKNKAAFLANKAFMIGEAVMNTYTGATKALASHPPPFNYIAAAATVAAGMANVAQIRAQSFEGGGFTGVGARAGGLDGKGGYMAMVHPNETIIDHTKNQSATSQPINVSFNIQANDTAGFDSLLQSRRGMITSMVQKAVNNRGKRIM